MTSAAANQFGDTTYTKVFVGGLAWETQKETMKKYFDQFGDILEAVVITDKSTGRSKGYGFVTFREAEAAMKSCVDAAPVIDGRRANCNLASLGVQRSKPSTPNKHNNNQGGVGEKKSYKIMSTFQTAEGAAFASHLAFPAHYAFHHQTTFPYNVYGYPQYSSDYTYPTTNYYGMYGGGATTGHQQYPAAYYGAAAATTGLGGGMMNGAAAAFYPNNYFNHQYDALVPASTAAAAGYGGYGTGGFQFPNHHHAYPYSTGGAAAMINSTGTYHPHHQHYAASQGVKMALHASIPHR